MTSSSDNIDEGKNNLLATLDSPSKPIKLISNVLLYNVNVSSAELFQNEATIPNIQAKA